MTILRKIAAFVIVMMIIGWVFENTLLRDFLEFNAEQYLQVKKIENCDVVYFSASSNFSQSLEEKDQRKISQMLGGEFPNQQFEAINKPASHAGVYNKLIDVFSKDAEVKTFVITMNLRSFGPDWIFSELEPALNKSNIMYNDRPPIINRLLIGFQAYRVNTLEERNVLRKAVWDQEILPVDEPRNSVTKWCAEYKWGDWTNPKRQLADQFIKQYGFIIDEENPRIKDFHDIVEKAKKRKINLLFHILPENVEKADSLVGPDLVKIMESNAQYLTDRYSSEDVMVVNSLKLLPSRHFTDKDFPTEHYDDDGRMQVARAIAKKLKEQ